MLFLHRAVLGDHSLGRCYVATYGPPGALGETHGKSLWEFIVAADSGLLATTPTVILRYRGTKQATVLGLAEGPDGIYFTDFFGESAGEPESPVGNVWRLAPSVATASTPSGAVSDTAGLTPAERGERMFLRNCTPCHRLDGVGGGEGPDLTYLHEDLLRRLGSPGYQSLLEKLLKDEGEFFVRQRPRLLAVRDAVDGDSLLRIWLKHHIEEPRFDNPFSKMPGFTDAIGGTQRDEIVDFLMSRSGITPAPAPRE
jgi:mono/diheme cytochrome c family protein